MASKQAVIGFLLGDNPPRYIGRYIYESEGLVDHSIDEAERLGWTAKELGDFWGQSHWVHLTGKNFELEPVRENDATHNPNAPISMGDIVAGPNGSTDIIQTDDVSVPIGTLILISLGDSVITTYHVSGRQWTAVSSAQMVIFESQGSSDN